jgi:hypothetical protein
MNTAPLWTDDLLAALAANGKSSAAAIARDGNTPDHVPLLKLFTPMGSATWVLTEYHPEDERFFGLCDLGMGSPELGYVSRAEIEETAHSRRPPLIERDLYFRPAYSLSVYTEAAARGPDHGESPRSCGGERSSPMKTVTAIVMLLAMTAHANAFISSTDCRFGRGFGGCTTTVVTTPDAGPRIIRVMPVANAERDAQWEAACKPTFRTDKLGVTRYVYAREGCEFGRIDGAER